MSTPRRLVILGATGTVGVQTLKIIEQAQSALQVVAMSAHSRSADLQALGIDQPGCALYLTGEADQQAELLDFLRHGNYDICLNAVVGAAGLPYSEAVLSAGCDLALANKESLVLAGELLSKLARVTGAAILPVDSEHSAIHQCLQNASSNSIRRLYLTASGGALRDLPLEDFAQVTPEMALAHPNWDMGPRITVDSATMMNKCLEIIEACHLFDVPADQIQVLIHRQSVVHSMVEFLDGSMLAQLGPPDMCFPIHYALHYPERAPSPLQGFDPQLFAKLTFNEPETERYPALKLGWQAARKGGAAGAVLNAADEVAVQAFLDGKLGFLEIAELCATVLNAMPDLPSATLDQILAADAWARSQATAALEPTHT
jgi:1-deoxy-D-xylulose-5-phosphate reductoisomerase